VGRRATILVLDGVGIGAARDAEAYGDEGSDTLGNVARAVGRLELPGLARLGLGTLAVLPGLSATVDAAAARCTMHPASAGKDSTTGHWELCGLVVDRPFPTYPTGFPTEVVEPFARLTGRDVIGNVAGSGTALIDELAAEQARTGAWIVYTSADSVFQVAAHEDVIPLTELYEACVRARALLQGDHGVARVIARPFVGVPGAYRRTAHRRDYSLPPVAPTLLDALAAVGVPRCGVGKVDDLFANRGITSRHTVDNADGLKRVASWLAEADGGFLLANLVDFDQQYGHRNDVQGFYKALQDFDAALPGLLASLKEDDLFAITADHGNDPTTPSTDHSRERVPMLLTGARVRPVQLAERSTFADLGATIAEWFGLDYRGAGTSFLRAVTA
jgi:phosphopentomutase